MIKFYIPHSENLYIFQNAKYIYFKMQNILITVPKTCEEVCRLNMTSIRKLSFIVEKPYNKTVIDFNIDRHKNVFTLKSNITALVNITFSGR